MGRPGASLHVNVPNAYSLHRQIARSIGLIADEKELSTRNQDLQQPRIYDAESLRTEVAEAGLEVVGEGGYFLKPFTHGQMLAILSSLPEGILEGLWILGYENPGLASEIFVNATIQES